MTDSITLTDVVMTYITAGFLVLNTSFFVRLFRLERNER